MRFHWSAIARLCVMGAIVATLWFPPAAVLALACSALGGFPVRLVATFGDRMHALAGVVLWWLIVFVPALVYSAVFLPWEETQAPL
jgi:hypothetical protein